MGGWSYAAGAISMGDDIEVDQGGWPGPKVRRIRWLKHMAGLGLTDLGIEQQSAPTATVDSACFRMFASTIEGRYRCSIFMPVCCVARGCGRRVCGRAGACKVRRTSWSLKCPGSTDVQRHCRAPIAGDVPRHASVRSPRASSHTPWWLRRYRPLPGGTRASKSWLGHPAVRFWALAEDGGGARCRRPAESWVRIVWLAAVPSHGQVTFR